MAAPVDPPERAHLRDAAGYTPPIHRYAPAATLADAVRRFWMPVWSLPPGATSVQRVLQYPVCLTVISSDHALLVGPSSGLSTQELSGAGWALGTMYQPALGRVLAAGAVDGLTDRVVPLAADDLVQRVREAIGDDPDDPARRAAAVATMEEWIAALGPVDEEGLLVNAIAEHIEGDPSVQRVSQVCQRFAISERSLQRLTSRRIGLSPKWLVQRRRLHEVAERLRADEIPDLARVAADLGYADQAHLGRDFKAVTGLTPREFATEPRSVG